MLGGDLTIVHSDLDGAFLSNQINSVRKFDIARIAQGKSIVHLQADELKKIFIFYPSIQEQRKISAFIDKSDKRIEIQNKIIPVKKSQIISLVIEIAIAILSLIGSIVSFNSFSICNNLIKLLWTIFKEVKRLWSQKKQ